MAGRCETSDFEALRAADGLSKIGFTSGAAMKGRAYANGGNNSKKAQVSLPTGVVSRLSGNVVPSIRLVTGDGSCVGAIVPAPKDDGVQYKAQKK